MSATHTPGPWMAGPATRVYAADGGEVAVATKADPTHRHAAAFRSLGAGTPEAQAALRVLVRRAIDDAASRRIYRRGINGRLEQSATEFAALATPTEEGR